jgi:CheY-like chemotaxis protein
MKTILIVDDEHDIVLALELFLLEEGYEVRIAHNGREALERLAEGRPDLVLMDVMMPIMSGTETIRHMKEDDEYSKIPIVLMSAVWPHFEKADCPWNAFLRKPFEIDLVLLTLKEVLHSVSKS